MPRTPIAALSLAACAFATAAFMPPAHATVHDLRAYFDALGPTYPVQQVTNLWTVQHNDHNGALFTPSGDIYLGPMAFQYFGRRVDTGTWGCQPSYCDPVPPDTTLATFDGVFVSPPAVGWTAAIFRAPEAMWLSEIHLWSETILNGHRGDGFNVAVQVVRNGYVDTIGGFFLDYNGTVSTHRQDVFTPGVMLQSGDSVEVLFGARGGQAFDQGNVNIWITTSVPETATWALMLAGLAGVATLTRRRSCASAS